MNNFAKQQWVPKLTTPFNFPRTSLSKIHEAPVAIIYFKFSQLGSVLKNNMLTRSHVSTSGVANMWLFQNQGQPCVNHRLAVCQAGNTSIISLHLFYKHTQVLGYQALLHCTAAPQHTPAVLTPSSHHSSWRILSLSPLSNKDPKNVKLSVLFPLSDWLKWKSPFLQI